MDIDLVGAGVRGRGTLRSDIEWLVDEMTATFTIGQIPELEITALDPGDRLIRSGLGQIDATVKSLDQDWQVGAIDFEKLAPGTRWTVRARSAVARTLRHSPVKAPGRTEQSTRWVASLAHRAGLRAIIQPSARKAGDADHGGALKVLDSLAQGLGWNWAQWGRTLVFADPNHALLQDVGLPRYPVTWGTNSGSDADGFVGHITDDDASTTGTATAELPYAAGSRLRPYMVLAAGAGFEGPLRGDWLVESVKIPVWSVEPRTVQVELARPRKGKPQPVTPTAAPASHHSTVSVTGVQRISIGHLGGDWIEPRDKRWSICRRTPQEAVSWALSQVGRGSLPDGLNQYHHCLAFISWVYFGQGGHGGAYAREVWEKAPSAAKKSPGDYSPPAGALCLWSGQFGGGAGHIAISVGGGWMVGTGSSSIRRMRVDEYRSPAYYGAMTPHWWR